MRRACPVALAAARAPGSPALTFGDATLSYGELERLVRRTARRLTAAGVGPGASVALLAGNGPEWLFLFHACARLGAALVPLNLRLTDEALGGQLRRAAPRLIVVSAALVERCRSVELGTPRLALEALSTETLSTEAGRTEGEPTRAVASAAAGTRGCGGAAQAEALATVDEGDVAAVLYTSGTTGTPKRVELTHRSFFASAAASAANLGGAGGERWLCALPLFHVGGLAMLQRCAVQGAALELEPSFEPAHACAKLRSGAISHASLVPTALARVLDAAAPVSEASGLRPFQGLRAVLVGGGPVSARLLQRARAAGLPVLQTYGLTEACSQVCTERPHEADGETAGPPLPGLEVRIAALDGPERLPNGVGGIEVRGPTVALAPGAWLATGDLGALDARGRLRVWSRRVDLIVSGGENVSPSELELALEGCPGVVELAVVPRADEQWGQVPVACVVLSPGFDAREFLAWARTRVAGFQAPRDVLCVPALPRNGQGKLLRAALRDAVEAAAASSSGEGSSAPGSTQPS